MRKLYEEIRLDSDKPAEAVENEMASYIQSREFQARYPAAYEKWLDAEKVLWAKQPTKRQGAERVSIRRVVVHEAKQLLPWREIHQVVLFASEHLNERFAGFARSEDEL